MLSLHRTKVVRSAWSLHRVLFVASNFACEGAVDVHKILMVCFQMKFNMFEHVFQVLKAVDNDL